MLTNKRKRIEAEKSKDFIEIFELAEVIITNKILTGCDVSLQNSLLYILLQIVHANYCAPYPK